MGKQRIVRRHDYLDIPESFAITERPMNEAERKALRNLAGRSPWKVIATVAALLCGLNAFVQLLMYTIYGVEQVVPGNMPRIMGAATMAALAVTLLVGAWLLPKLPDRTARRDLNAGLVQVLDLRVQQLSELICNDDPETSHVAADVGQGWLLLATLSPWLSVSCETDGAWPTGNKYAERIVVIRAPLSGRVIALRFCGKLQQRTQQVPTSELVVLLPQFVFLQASMDTLQPAVDLWIQKLPMRRK